MRPCRQRGQRTRICDVRLCRHEGRRTRGAAALPSRRMTYSQRWDCGLAIPQDDVLASEGLGKHHRAGSPITQRDDGHAGLDDDCAPAMTRRTGRVVCARTDAACPGVMLIAGQIVMKPSRLFYKRARCLGFQIFLEHGGNPSSVNPAAGRTLPSPGQRLRRRQIID